MNENQALMETQQEVQSLEDKTAQMTGAQNQNGAAISIKKRIIWVTGGKGGTGKSTFARGLLHLLIAAGIENAAFDGDPTNAQLHRYYKDCGDGVTRIGIKQRDGADAIVSQMEDAGTPVILIDVPGGGGDILVRLEEEIGLLSALTEIGYGMTMVSLLSRIKDSINQLKHSMDITEGFDVAHVAVKNLYYGESKKFRFLDRSKTKLRLLENGGHVLEMRDLFEDTYERLDDYDFSFHAAMTADRKLFPSPDVRRVKQWTKHFEQQVSSTGGLFGL